VTCRDHQFEKFLQLAAEARAADPPFTAEQWDTLRQLGIYPSPDEDKS
jgi:hypothetical protein